MVKWLTSGKIKSSKQRRNLLVPWHIVVLEKKWFNQQNSPPSISTRVKCRYCKSIFGDWVDCLVAVSDNEQKYNDKYPLLMINNTTCHCREKRWKTSSIRTMFRAFSWGNESCAEFPLRFSTRKFVKLRLALDGLWHFLLHFYNMKRKYMYRRKGG